MQPPKNPKIYHIVHYDRLQSIIKKSGLLCDNKIKNFVKSGTSIGMGHIKKRRTTERKVEPFNLYISDFVPFYFCPRSIMLYVIYKANSGDLEYKGGQEPIIHLETNCLDTISWAEKNDLKWSFTKSNASAEYTTDFYVNTSDLKEIDWDAIRRTKWVQCKEEKQAEFLVEKFFSWELIQRIGVHSTKVKNEVERIMKEAKYKPCVEIKRNWYY